MQTKSLIIISLLVALLMGCSKKETKKTIDLTNAHFKISCEAVFSTEKSTTNAEANENNQVPFVWYESNSYEPEMIALVYGETDFLKWTSNPSDCYSRTSVVPNSNDKARATLTPSAQLIGKVMVGSPVYGLYPVKSSNSKLINQQAGLLAELNMPNSFVNNKNYGLSYFKDYIYVSSTTNVAAVDVPKSEGMEGTVKCNEAKFKALSSAFGLNITNNLPDNTQIKVKKVIVKAIKNNTEHKLFPNKIRFLITKDAAYAEDNTNKEEYYSSIEASTIGGMDIAPNGKGIYYMLFFPTKVSNAYKDVSLQFDIIALLGEKEMIYTINSSFENLTDNNFVSGSIYSFNLILDKNTLCKENKTHYSDGEYVLASAGDYEKCSKIVVTGDGYIKDDLKVGGKMDSDLNKAIDAVFSVEPYKSNKKYFKVYKLFAESKGRGVSGYSDESGKYKKVDTKYNVVYTEPESSGLECDETVLFSLLNKLPGYDVNENPNTTTVIVILNNPKYAGTCYMYEDGFAIALCPMNFEANRPEYGVNVNYRNIILHEFCGHGYGRLGDEYILYPRKSILDDKTDLAGFKKEKGFGMNPNVSLINDRTKVEWHEFIGHPNYSKVNLFEGGYYYGKGVWRCEDESCMDKNIPYFSAYSRFVQYQRMKKAVGETCSFEDFVAIDASTAAQGASAVSIPITSSVVKPYPRLAPPKRKKKLE